MVPLRDSTKKQTFPIITILLIIVNLLIHFYTLSLSEEAYENLLYSYGNVPNDFINGTRFFLDIRPFLTSAFLHGSWSHIIGNMWFLWLFGDNVEDRMGHIRFLVFYLVCAVIAGALDTVVSLSIGNGGIPSIGASGAIAGVMGAYFLMFRKAKIFTYIPPIFFFNIPAFIYLGIWIILQLINGFTMDGTEGVGFWAHIGGFGAGMLLNKPFSKRNYY